MNDLADDIKNDENLDETEENEEDFIEAELVDEDDEAGENLKDEKNEDNEYKDRYQRLLADFTNYKKREESQKEDFKKFASSSLIEKLLSVLDNLDRALDKADSEDPFVKGVMMTRAELIKILQNEGLEEIESDGVEFDHNFHQAVLAEESDTVESNYIIETFQKGYTLNGRVLRPAMVKVAK